MTQDTLLKEHFRAAVQAADLTEVQRLFAAGFPAKNSGSLEGAKGAKETALHIALCANNLPMLTCLLHAMGDQVKFRHLSCEAESNGDNLLHAAARCGDLHMLTYVIRFWREHAFNFNLPNRNNETAISIVRKRKDEALAACFVSEMQHQIHLINNALSLAVAEKSFLPEGVLNLIADYAKVDEAQVEISPAQMKEITQTSALFFSKSKSSVPHEKPKAPKKASGSFWRTLNFFPCGSKNLPDEVPVSRPSNSDGASQKI